MASPMPIYIFEMRDQAEDWLEYGLFSFFADRQGAYMGYEWVGCSYEPLARIRGARAQRGARPCRLSATG